MGVKGESSYSIRMCSHRVSHLPSVLVVEAYVLVLVCSGQYWEGGMTHYTVDLSARSAICKGVCVCVCVGGGGGVCVRVS